MYSRDLSATLKRDEALDWLARAAAQGHESAGKEHGELESAPDGVVANPAVAPADAEAGGADRPV